MPNYCVSADESGRVVVIDFSEPTEEVVLDREGALALADRLRRAVNTLDNMAERPQDGPGSHDGARVGPETIPAP
jgi:hypothetical protein